MSAKTTKRKGTKKRRAPTRGRRGPPSVEVTIMHALDRGLSAQIERTAKSVFGRIELLASRGEQIPASLLGAARVCVEWHTDFLSVQSGIAGPGGNGDVLPPAPPVDAVDEAAKKELH